VSCESNVSKSPQTPPKAPKLPVWSAGGSLRDQRRREAGSTTSGDWPLFSPVAAGLGLLDYVRHGWSLRGPEQVKRDGSQQVSVIRWLRPRWAGNSPSCCSTSNPSSCSRGAGGGAAGENRRGEPADAASSVADRSAFDRTGRVAPGSSGERALVFGSGGYVDRSGGQLDEPEATSRSPLTRTVRKRWSRCWAGRSGTVGVGPRS